jgi:NAD+ kinase
LEVSCESQEGALHSFPFALNDIAISRKETTSMITIETWLNDEFLNSYWSDGIIISTPTGSTGYSLSCGGPIITPQTKSFVITPIAPHNLNARPLVIPDDLEIKLKISGREDQYLIALDSRLASLDKDTIVRIKKADFKIKLVWLFSDSFITTLRKKLLWGQDKRN